MKSQPIADIHAHILPGVDDGCQTLEETLDTVGEAYMQGVRLMIATPHYGIENGYAPPAELVKRRFALLKAEVGRLFPDMELHLGAEINCPSAEVALRRLESGESFSLAGSRYAMFEFMGGYCGDLELICGSMIEIAKDGRWLPILAHAERYRAFAGNEELYDRMTAAGVYIQVNAYSLNDPHSETSRSLARYLVDNALAHFLGSDTHGYNRPPMISSGTEYIHTNCPTNYADKLLFGTANELIGDSKGRGV